MKTHHLLPFFLAVFLLEACSGNKITEGKSLDDCSAVTTSTDDNNYLFIGKIKSEINDLALNIFTAGQKK